MDRKGILEDLVRELTSLPGIGRKTAQRLAFHILKQPREDAERLARAVLAVKERLGLCRQCRNLAEGVLCDICRDPARDSTRVVVVEDVTTLYAFERTGGDKGVYHVRSGEDTSEIQSQSKIVLRLFLLKKKQKYRRMHMRGVTIL